jgi:hypothetical protein
VRRTQRPTNPVGRAVPVALVPCVGLVAWVKTEFAGVREGWELGGAGLGGAFAVTFVRTIGADAFVV